MIFFCDCVDFAVPKTYFVNREFSFTLKDDVYLRYQSFSDQQELEKEILKRNPYKIDIGAVFTHKASLSLYFIYVEDDLGLDLIKLSWRFYSLSYFSKRRKRNLIFLLD